MSALGDEKSATAAGPWGSPNGSQWDDGVYSGVKQIVLRHGKGIESIQFEYDKQGSQVGAKMHGGCEGYKTEKVKLDYPKEYLASIHGYYGNLEGSPLCVRSLTFQSNLKKNGPYGIQQGTYFSSPANDHQIIGFYGTSSSYLDSIGAHLKPIVKNNMSTKSLVHSPNMKKILLAFSPPTFSKQSSPTTCSKQSSSSSEFDNNSDDKKKEKIPALPSKKEKACLGDGGLVTYGPWGGNEGTVFNDGVYTGVREIHLSRNMGISNIRVMYDQNGRPVWGSINGGTEGPKTDKIIFNYPVEVLTNITGYHGPVNGYTTIRSLTFHTTTKTKYGPYGEERGVAFSTNLKEGKIVGFHGRKGLSLDAIGVHVVKERVTLATRHPENLVNDAEVASNAKNWLGTLKDTKHVANKSSPITYSKQRSSFPESDNSSDDENKEKV